MKEKIEKSKEQLSQINPKGVKNKTNLLGYCESH